MAQEQLQDRSARPAGGAAGEQTDAASRSLADALRLSFRLLSVIMVIVLVLLLLTGTSVIDPDERGVKLLFGRIHGEGAGRVLGEGLKWSWPEPVGRVEKVPIREQKLVIDDFWYHETPQLELDIQRGTISNEGLRPGWDGALLTGDRALVHVKFTCNYRIGIRNDSPDPDAIIEFVSNTMDFKEVIRSAICNAAIYAAATRTVDSILTTGKDRFRRAVEDLAQRRLDEMRSGVRIESIQIGAPKVPLAAITAFDAVTSARQEEDLQVNKAIGERNSLLERAAGESWKELVGEPEAPGEVPGLLLRYAQAREDKNQAAAEQLLAEIERLLISKKTAGTAAEIIENANRYSATIRQRVAKRAERFEQLIDKFLATPDLMLQRLWAETMQDILTSPTIEQIYLTPGEKTILQVNQDPEVRRRILEEMLKAKREGRQALPGRAGH